MFCPKCGKWNTGMFCVFCGYDLKKSLVLSDKSSGILFDYTNASSFLAVCILLSISFAAGFLCGSMDVFKGLIVLGVWLLFASSNSKSKKLQRNGAAVIAVTLRIQYILVFVLSGIIALCGIAAFAVLMISGRLYDELGDMIAESSELVSGWFYSLSDFAHSMEGVLLGIAVMIGFFIAAVILLILNLVFGRYFSGYALSISRGLKNSTYVKYNEPLVFNRILAFGIISAVVGISSLFTGFDIDTLSFAISSAVLCAACIIAYVKRPCN